MCATGNANHLLDVEVLFEELLVHRGCCYYYLEVLPVAEAFLYETQNDIHEKIALVSFVDDNAAVVAYVIILYHFV